MSSLCCPACRRSLPAGATSCPDCGRAVPPAVPGYEMRAQLPNDRWGTAWRAARLKDRDELEVHMVEDSRAARADEFVRRLRGLGALESPRIVPVLAAGRTDSAVYYLTRTREGETLARFRERKPKLPERACLKIALDLAEALALLARAGIRHGPIFPEDVQIRPDGGVQLRAAGVPQLVLEFAPGLLDDPIAAAGARSDLVGLGTLLHLCAAGRPPDRGGIEGVSPGFAALVADLTSERPPDLEAAVGRIQALAGTGTKGRPAAAEAPASPEVPQPAVPRRGVAALASGLAVGVLSVAAAIVLLASSGETEAPPPTNPPPVQGPADKAPDRKAAAETALGMLRLNLLDPVLEMGEYPTALDALDDFARVFPEIPTHVARTRESILTRAEEDCNRLRARANEYRDQGARDRALEELRKERVRFVGVDRYEGLLDEMIADLAGGPVPPRETPPPRPPPRPGGDSNDEMLAVAEKQFEEARALYEQGHRSDSKTLLTEAGFKAEQAKIKLLALQDMVEGARRSIVSQRIVQVNQLSKLIADRLKSAR